MDPIEPTPSASFPPPQRRGMLEELSAGVQRLPAWLFALLSLAGVFMLYQFVGGLLTFAVFGMELTEANVHAFRIATMGAQVVLILLPTILLAKLRFPGTRNVFRFGGVNVQQLFLVLVGVFALQQVLQGYLMAQESVPLPLPPFVEELIDKMKVMMEQMYRLLTSADSLPEFFFVVLVIAVTPAFCEEMLFRGLVQRTLEESEPPPLTARERKRKGLVAAVVAGLIFGMYHLNPFTFVALASLGIFFGLVVYRTGNITLAVIAHFFNNFLACLALYLRLDESYLAIAPSEIPTFDMIIVNVVVNGVVFVAATYYFIRITVRPDETIATSTYEHTLR